VTTRTTTFNRRQRPTTATERRRMQIHQKTPQIFACNKPFRRGNSQQLIPPGGTENPLNKGTPATLTNIAKARRRHPRNGRIDEPVGESAK